MLTISVLLASVTLGGPVSDPLAAAHDRKDSSHVMHLLFVSSTIELVNKDELNVYGRRREIACPSGAVITDSSCDPCTEKLSVAPTRPTSTWLYEISWSNTTERAQALAEYEHFARYFNLTLAGGSDRNGHTYQDYRFDGPKKAAAAPSLAAAVEVSVGGKAATEAVIPAGSLEIELEARAFKKADDGSLQPMPEAKIDWNTPCGAVRTSPNPHIAFFSLKPGTERCVVKAFASPGQALGAISVTRDVTVGIVFEGAEPDEVVLQGETTAEFSYRATASGQPTPIDAEWKAIGGRIEMIDGPKKIRFRIDPDTPQAEVTLTDKASGAGDRVVIRRPR
jgi:hypothetical protein